MGARKTIGKSFSDGLWPEFGLKRRSGTPSYDAERELQRDSLTTFTTAKDRDHGGQTHP